jgi:predicted AlkP superfamily phosphohydrolase/phosphomutase
VILGFDGMDPNLADEMMGAGQLPDLKRLADQGDYRRLRTTCPALSPVAWSSFATGVDPSRHGIFDFLSRDPRDYRPVLSSVSTTPPRRVLRLGKRAIPLSRGHVELRRRSRSWWQLLGEQGVFCSVLRVPITYPPEKLHGVMLSGMCVPDLRGTQGTFTAYSTRERPDWRSGDGEWVELEGADGHYTATVVGPPAPFSGDGGDLSLPLALEAQGQDGAAQLRVGRATLKLEAGEWSAWTPLEFGGTLGPRARGICQFLLLEASPDVTLYQSPIHIDPEAPAVPISYPPYYSNYLAKKLGPFSTLGLAEDTSALDEGVLDEASFLTQVHQFHDERERIFLDALHDTRDGVCAVVFDTTDRVQHMFFRTLQEEGPDHPVRKVYRRMDDLVGRVMEHLGSDDVLMVMSDHGFMRFDRGVNLNTWLLQNGYLHLREGCTSDDWLAGIDWARTRAYSVGLAGIFLNLRGREGEGIVEPGEEADALRAEIATRLSELRDPGNGGAAPVRRVVDCHEAFSGPYVDRAPDLLVGYASGYRVSWESAKGRATPSVLDDNTKHWSGDHCVDPDLVPGVLFSSRPLGPDDPSIIDIGPTVLRLFGVEAPAHMQGRALIAESGGAADPSDAPREHDTGPTRSRPDSGGARQPGEA